MKKLFLIFFLGILFLPLTIQAAGIYQADGINVCYEGLVPCGKGKPYWEQGTIVDGECQGIKVSEGVHCQFCHFFVVFKALIDFTLKIVVFIAVLMIVISGLMFFFSAGNPEKVVQATKTLRTIIFGLIIIFCSWLFVNIFFTAIGVANWTKLKDGWFVADCPITLQGDDRWSDPGDPEDPGDPGPNGLPSTFTLTIIPYHAITSLGGNYIESNDGKIDCGGGNKNKCSAEYPSGTNVSLTASKIFTASFLWDSCSTATDCDTSKTVMMNGNKEIRACWFTWGITMCEVGWRNN